MVTVEQFVDLLLSQAGDRYIFGVEVSADDDNPSAFDCSELVQWGCDHLGVSPRMPDGSWNQANHCRIHGTLISVDQGVATRGALLFKFSSSPFEGSRPSSAHVAVSLGNGKTIEARSTHYGVGSFSAYNRGWTHAGLIPGLDNYANIQEDNSMADFVEIVQRQLNAHGFDAGPVDGDPGPKTEAGVKAALDAIRASAPVNSPQVLSNTEAISGLSSRTALIEGKLEKVKGDL